jgi:16S rRNA (adenine(1408)-N(1))-methyltransferase
VRAAVEELPLELSGVADAVTVVLPWGSLLAALVRPSASALTQIRGVCGPGATLTVVISVDAARDAAAARRLGLPPLDAAHLHEALPSAYAAAGFAVTSVRPIDARELAAWPSSWAKRLAHGRPRSALRIEARAGRPAPIAVTV